MYAFFSPVSGNKGGLNSEKRALLFLRSDLALQGRILKVRRFLLIFASFEDPFSQRKIGS